MVDISGFEQISPYVRMVRLKKEASMSGKWKDIDNVFTYIASGSADFILDGFRYSLQAGNAIIIPPFMTHVIISKGTEALIQYIVHFDFYESEERRCLIHKDVLDEDEKHLTVSGQEKLLNNQAVIAAIPEMDRNPLMYTYLNMLEEFSGNRLGRNLMLKAGCTELIVATLRNCVDINEEQNNSRRKTKSWVHIENAMDYILGCDLREDLSNDSIALAIGVSTNYLTSIFQTYLGISLHKYVTNVRIERAQQMLLSGRVNVTETANRTGFSSIHVFSKTFKSIMGISPSQFLDEIVTKSNNADRFTQLQR